MEGGLILRAELTVALGDVIEEARIGAQLVGPSELGDRLFITGEREQAVAERDVTLDVPVRRRWSRRFLGGGRRRLP
jgi:hypothetical protein